MKKLAALFFSLRPNVWPRILAEMILGASLASHASLLQTRFISFFLVTVCIASASYLLNDITDKDIDAHHVLRRKRPIAQGIISVKTAVMAIGLLVLIALAISMATSLWLMLAASVLIFSEVLYTLPLFRFKEKAGFDVGLNGVNAGVRFTVGFFGASAMSGSFPFLFLGFAVCLKLLFFLFHRWQNRTLEQRAHFKSTAALLSKSAFYMAVSLLSALCIIFYYASITAYHLSPLLFLLPFAGALFAFPILLQIKKGFLATQEKNEATRNYVYLYLLGFALVFFLFAQR